MKVNYEIAGQIWNSLQKEAICANHLKGLIVVLNDWIVDSFLISNGKAFHSLAPITVKESE